MKLIGPYAVPGVVHDVKLKDGTIVDALMTMGREPVLPDGTWITFDAIPVVVTDMIDEVIGTRYRERLSLDGLLKR